MKQNYKYLCSPFNDRAIFYIDEINNIHGMIPPDEHKSISNSVKK